MEKDFPLNSYELNIIVLRNKRIRDNNFTDFAIYTYWYA